MTTRRTFLAVSALSAGSLAGCGDGGGKNDDGGGRGGGGATERATGWTQMPPELYAKTPPIQGNFVYSDEPRYDLTDANFLSLRGEPTRMPAVDTQGNLGSCTAWAVGYAAGTQVLRNAGELSGDGTRDALSPADLFGKIQRRPSPGACTQGATISAAMDVLVQEGAATLAMVPYSDRICPAGSAGLAYHLDGFSRVSGADFFAIRGSLQSKQPICFGMQVNQAFQALNATNNIFSPTGSGGGHAMAVVGYDDARQLLKVQNSWGTDWGAEGYFWISYANFARFATDVCIPFRRRRSQNELLTNGTSNSSVNITMNHMNARRFGSGVPGSYGVGIEIGWSSPLLVSAATISLLDDMQNVLYTKNFDVSQVARGTRFGTLIPDGVTNYTVARSTVTGSTQTATVTLTGSTRPYSR